jgi:hypothetical protein
MELDNLVFLAIRVHDSASTSAQMWTHSRTFPAEKCSGAALPASAIDLTAVVGDAEDLDIQPALGEGSA